MNSENKIILPIRGCNKNFNFPLVSAKNCAVMWFKTIIKLLTFAYVITYIVDRKTIYDILNGNPGA